MSVTGAKQVERNARPVWRDASVSGNQTSVKGAHAKNPCCTRSCGIRLPRKSEDTAARVIKHLGCKFAKGLRLVVMRKKKSQPLRVPSSGRSQPSVIPVVVDTQRTEAIEDCIQFINSSSSFTRSNSTSARPT